jgi:putative ABC transport system permease protein
MENLIQDLRFAVRMFLKKPAMTALVVLALALGIGANTAIFSVFQAVLLRPLPYADSDQLVWIWGKNQSLGIAQGKLSPPDLVDFQEQSQTLEKIAGYMTLPINLTSAENPERLESVVVTNNFFQVLGVQPTLGRDFQAEEGGEQNEVVIISHGLWQRRFAGSNVIGQKLLLDGRTFLIVGVAPKEFQFPIRTELWIPCGPTNFDARGEASRLDHFLQAVGRVKRGVPLEQARAEMDTITRRIEQQNAETSAGWGVTLIPFREYLLGNTRIALLVLMGAVVFVLLIACANVANLLLARAASRTSEIAVRIALGASRARLIRQLLTESVLLSVISGAVGLLLAAWGIRLLAALGPDSIPQVKEIGINTTVLGFTVLVALLTGIIFGLAPAFHLSKTDLNETLKEGGRPAASFAPRNRLRTLLVVSEVSLALVLLIGAGLMLRSFWRLSDVDPGLKADNVLTMGISLNRAKYPEGNPRTAFFQQVIQRVESLPGVQSVGAISHLPLGGRGVNVPLIIENSAIAAAETQPNADLRIISPNYFRAMGIPLKKGRPFTEQDTKDTQKIVIVNEAFAQRYWPNGDAVGQQVEVGIGEDFKSEVIGVVGNVKHRGLDQETPPEIYVSYLQSTLWPVMNLVVKTSSDPSSLVPPVRQIIQGIDREQPIFNVKTMDQLVSESIGPRRFNTLLLAVFAIVALILAAVGVYGVMSYSVTQRTHEIGIRMALGAQPGDIVKLILRNGMILILVGIVIGLAVAFTLTRLISSLLYGIESTDMFTFLSLPLLLAAVAFLACYIPAYRAARVAPLIALRYE